MASENENNADLTAKILELNNENNDLKLKLKAFEDAERSHCDELSRKDAEISKLNKILVDNLLTRVDPNGTPSENDEKSPMDFYADQLKRMRFLIK